MTPKNIIVIGSGPAGLVAAIAAGEAGARVLVLERMRRAGLKLLASGGGRANVTNVLSTEEFIARYGQPGDKSQRQRARFMLPALRNLPNHKLLAQLEAWGVRCECVDGFHYFPEGNRAKDVLAALRQQLERLGIEIRLNAHVKQLLIEDGRIAGVKLEEDELLPADGVILASGGTGYSNLGGNRSGFDLARQAGHDVTPLVPGMVALRTKETWPGEIAGISVPGVEIRIAQKSHAKQSWRGGFLFTHRGISGPAILSASAHVCRLLESQATVPLQIRMIEPERDEVYWREQVTRWREREGKQAVQARLAQWLPQRLAAKLCEVYGINEDTAMAQLRKQQVEDLITILHGPTLTINGSEGFERAMVTSGGIALADVHPGTLASRKTVGLHFAGEVLDIDGPCGGFNLQWCMASGWLAGASAAKNDGASK